MFKNFEVNRLKAIFLLLTQGNVPKLCLPENTGVMLSEVCAVPDENTRVMTSAAVKTNSPKVFDHHFKYVPYFLE